LGASILELQGPFARLPFPQYGAVCRQALAYAVSLGAAHLIPDLGAQSLEGEASLAEALKQVQLLGNWLASSESRTSAAAASGVDGCQRSAQLSTEVSHSPDFRSVHWYGTKYVFTPTQAACIRVLWEAWERRELTVGQDAILEAAGSAGARLRDVFEKAKHPAWGAMIVSPRKGAFCLAEPAKPA
jgi:hypothetical protein